MTIPLWGLGFGRTIVLRRLMTFVYELGSFFIPAGAVFAGLRYLFRTVGEMDALEATMLALTAAFFVGLGGLTAFRRWIAVLVRVGPLKLEVRGEGLAVGVGYVAPWGNSRYYQVGDLLVVNREVERVILRVTIPGYRAGGQYHDVAEPMNTCLQNENPDEPKQVVMQVFTSAGSVPHLPTEIVLERNQHARGHLDLATQLGGPGELTEEERSAEMAGAMDAFVLHFEDLITRRELAIHTDDLTSIGEDNWNGIEARRRRRRGEEV